MAAVCGLTAAAIECEGERLHPGDADIREDMERRTILERIGWRFVLIRGSEYYLDPEAAVDRAQAELLKLGVRPEKI